MENEFESVEHIRKDRTRDPTRKERTVVGLSMNLNARAKERGKMGSRL